MDEGLDPDRVLLDALATQQEVRSEIQKLVAAARDIGEQRVQADVSCMLREITDTLFHSNAIPRGKATRPASVVYITIASMMAVLAETMRDTHRRDPMVTVMMLTEMALTQIGEDNDDE